ncbi:MAG: cobalt transporter CbiM [Gammaproteobacteria bacterium]|nr:cobalt transporter CbiM [Gammaproteobacteria bacterium]
MHISEGILQGPTIAIGFAVAAVGAALTMRKMDLEEIPKISVITALFFVASLIKVPIGVASIHLILNGVAGIVLGKRAFVAIMIGIIFQAIIFGHGGLSVIGVNTAMMGTGALVAYGVWQLRHRFSFAKKEVVFAFIAAAMATITSGSILALALISTGEAFLTNASIIFTMHIPIMIIEGLVASAIVGFLLKTKPEVLAGYKRPESK